MSAGQALCLPASKAGGGGGAVATAGPLESPCSLETPPETPEGGLISSGMDASESAPEVGKHSCPVAILFTKASTQCCDSLDPLCLRLFLFSLYCVPSSESSKQR